MKDKHGAPPSAEPERRTQVFSVSDPAAGNDAIQNAADLLRRGGLVAFPTETVYGLGANGLDEAAVTRIFEAKGRPQDNPLILHIASDDQLDQYCADIPPAAYALAKRFWPGPLTLVLRRRPTVPDAVTAGLSTVAVRCPAHPVALALIRAAGVPVAAPSANRSGKPSPTRFAHVLADLSGRVDIMLDGGDCDVGVESTVLDLTESPPRLLRPGGVPLEALEEVLGKLAVDPAILHQGIKTEAPKSPGMKYRHYAPKAPVTVVSGPAANAVIWIRDQMETKQGPVGVLCFSEYADCFPGAVVRTLGPQDQTEAQARAVFHALRGFDDTEVTRIFAQCPPEEGLGRAVANRLKKAAGFHMIEPEAPPPRPVVFGITGGTGAGKTSALNVLARMGGMVIDCDAVYHTLLAESAPLRSALIQRFGAGILAEDGSIARKKLGEIVFDDPASLRTLNEITHRFVVSEVDAVLQKAKETGAFVAAIDAIALFESGLADRCHRTVGIIAPESLRVQRLMRRENISEAYAKLRISAQPPDCFFRQNCHAVLENTDNDLLRFSQRAAQLFISLLREVQKEGTIEANQRSVNQNNKGERMDPHE